MYVPLVGNPLAEATEIVVWADVMAEESVVLPPLPTRQMYEVKGVRSKTVGTLLSRLG